MQKIESFNQTTCKTVRAALEAAVQTVAQEYDIQVTTGNGSFSQTGDNFILKVECATKGEGGVVNTKEAEDFKRYCFRWDLTEDMLHEEFTDVSNSERYRVIGAKPRSQKYPIIVMRASDGKRYKFPADRVKRAFDALAETI